MTIEQTPEQRARVEDFQRKHRIVLLTLLFTDVIGSTRLKQILGERAAIALIQRHHALLREILARFADAEEIDTAGDSFFMVFAKPSDAVQFALLAQRAVRELARETGQPVLDRIGIHVGEVFIQDRGSERRNLFGIQIDSTARIMSLGKADQILLSRFAFDNARLVLRGFEMPGIGELGWLNHGYYELKGVEEPLEVCEVGETGLAALTPPGDSEKAHRFHAADAEPVLGWRPAAGQLVPETRWKLERPLGQGGFGEVWLAQHETLKQRRVLKFCFKAERARALKREATLFRVLRERFGEHPNIVAIHDVFFDAPPFYLVTDFVDGPSLDRWTGTHATLAEIPLEQRLEIVAQIADALQAAHDSGIIHRDVKPSNVLIADPAAATPRAKLVDFGIGQVVNPEALAGVTKLGFSKTMLYPGSGSGTPLYQAPELLAGQPATTRSDIYSLGVLLWQIVIGDFTQALATDWADQVPDPLLREDIRRCVTGDPQKRFAAAAELAARLRTLAQRRRTLDEEEARRIELERRAYRRGAVRAAAFTASVIVVITGLAVFAFHQAGVAKAEKRRADENARNDEAFDEAFADDPLQLRERVSDRLDAFHRSRPEPETFGDQQRRMRFHLRRAVVKLDAANGDEAGNLSQSSKTFYIQQELDGAVAELKESLHLGEILAKKAPEDRTVTRDRILIEFQFWKSSPEIKSFSKIEGLRLPEDFVANAPAHLENARALVEALVASSQFSAAQYKAWMDLPVPVATAGDPAADGGDKARAHELYEKALQQQMKPLTRRPNAADESKTPDPQDTITNGLGMRSVSVPGTNGRFSVYQTRVKDFRAFIRETGYVHMRETDADADSRMYSLDRDGRKQRGDSWEHPGFAQTDDHPVVGVSWYDAKAFCEWLTLREWAAGRLPKDRIYRLPTDWEWSVAVGLLEEDPMKTPEEKDNKILGRYPWGSVWPPPAGSGNYAGIEADDGHWPTGLLKTIPDYNDGFPRTAPVGPFKPNKLGLYDLGSNVSEWCEDEYHPHGDGHRVLRGGSWNYARPNDLLSACRSSDPPGVRFDFFGFRCVVGSSSP